MPFWVQIYNLPLKSRTKEMGWTIGSSLGSVLDVVVSKSRVQWGKSLRVRVHIDITKRLVRGKKITIKVVSLSGSYLSTRGSLIFATDVASSIML